MEAERRPRPLPLALIYGPATMSTADLTKDARAERVRFDNSNKGSRESASSLSATLTRSSCDCDDTDVIPYSAHAAYRWATNHHTKLGDGSGAPTTSAEAHSSIYSPATTSTADSAKDARAERV